MPNGAWEYPSIGPLFAWFLTAGLKQPINALIWKEDPRGYCGLPPLAEEARNAVHGFDAASQRS